MGSLRQLAGKEQQERMNTLRGVLEPVLIATDTLIDLVLSLVYRQMESRGM